MSRSRRLAIMISVFMICVTFLLVVLFVVCPLAGHPMLKRYSMPSHGMDPTITAGDVIVTEAFSFWASPPARGNVVVFRIAGIADIEHEHGASPDTVFVQRIAALAGDTLQFQPGRILVNGVEFVTRSEGNEIHYDGQMGRYIPLHYLARKITVPGGMSSRSETTLTGVQTVDIGGFSLRRIS